MKVSIVMAYYQRQALLDKTLESIDKSEVKDYELIIVDDASEPPLVCDRAKIIRVEKKDKWYTCSSVAWNMGMREATGDIIILQSPECYYVGDILQCAVNSIKPNLYLSFACYALNKEETLKFKSGINPTINNYTFTSKTKNGWFNHSQYRPVAYHFCSAVLRSDLDLIGGFDERFARGWAFDDDDFIRRIKLRGMDIMIIDSPFVIHQFHSHFEFSNPSVFSKPHAINQEIYYKGYDPKIPMDYGRNTDFYPSYSGQWELIVKNYNRFYLNYNGDRKSVIPRKLHMIWLGGKIPFKYIRLIAQWRKYHPDWEFRLWGDDDIGTFGMINQVAFDAVDNLGAKSDIFRYEILYRHGGLYVDTDFECLKPFDDLLYLDFFAGGRSVNPCVANGLMGCKPKDVFMKLIIDTIYIERNRMDVRLGNVMKKTGAELITSIYVDYIKKTSEKTVLFPDSFFYPMPNSFRYDIRGNKPEDGVRIKSYIKQNSYCVHLWYTSWIPDQRAKPKEDAVAQAYKDKTPKSISLDIFIHKIGGHKAADRRLPSSRNVRRII